MVKLRFADIGIIDDAFDMHGGYVLNFSDRTFAIFFDSEFGINIDDEKYRADGNSKAKRLRTFLRLENGITVAKVLRGLWRYKESLPSVENPWSDEEAEKDVKTPIIELISRIEAGGAALQTDAFDKFVADETLDDLIAAIERDIQANKPAVALDRLHTYCMKKTAHLIEKYGGVCNREDALHSRMGKYIKLLEEKRDLREISKRSLKSAISIFEKYNDVRNNESFAHDNELVDEAEARYIFDSITAILRLIKNIEADGFEEIL
ncbi:abortive infection family protein [Fulvivirgaceae bacterium BMA12]|uniref:Abortive infection family protein n=1 Tax=Agaribacillus aureus TaxID=3051825 RepID=A0ABT8LCS2_9BACT|nr:abortive infection family protein [Fulvivirgaceae bacterium BMA12]